MPHKDPEARREYHKNYMRDWYRRNKEKHIGYVAKVSKAYRAQVREYLNSVKDRPCMDCGGSFPPEAMDFDHMFEKKFNVGAGAGYGMEKIKEEIAKCEIVCANCHRVRTHARRKAGVVE